MIVAVSVDYANYQMDTWPWPVELLVNTRLVRRSLSTILAVTLQYSIYRSSIDPFRLNRISSEETLTAF